VILALRPEDLASAEDVDFEEEKEYWNTYKLSDGTTLKIRLILRGRKEAKEVQSRWFANLHCQQHKRGEGSQRSRKA